MPSKINEITRIEWVKSKLRDLPAGVTLLDAGAGECPFRKYCGHLDYIAQDFGQYDGRGDVGLQMGTYDNSKLDIVSDITEIPLPDESVDVILCTEVFEHIPDPIAAIKEFRRLLKKGGMLILTAPFASLTHFAPYHFAIGFSRYFYETNLSNFGFKIDEITMNGNYYSYLMQELYRVPNIAEKYNGKRTGIIGKIALYTSILLLKYLEKKGKRSSELLCFGIQTVSHKI